MKTLLLTFIATVACAKVFAAGMPATSATGSTSTTTSATGTTTSTAPATPPASIADATVKYNAEYQAAYTTFKAAEATKDAKGANYLKLKAELKVAQDDLKIVQGAFNGSKCQK